MPTSIFVRIDIPNAIDRPGVPIAQILREVTPVIENMIPLKSGFYADRLSGVSKAEWTVEVT